MQFEVHLQTVKSAVLGYNYHHPLGSALIHALSRVRPVFGESLHDGEHRSRLKLFAFSPLNGQPSPQKSLDGLVFGGRVYFRISSCWPELLYTLGEALMNQRKLDVSGVEFEVQSVNLVAAPMMAERMVWRPFGQSGTIVTAWDEPNSNYKAFQFPDNYEKKAPGCVDLLVGNLRHKMLRLKEIRPDIFENLLTVSNLSESEIKNVPILIDFLPLNSEHSFRTSMNKIKGINVLSWRCPVCVEAPECFQRLIWGSGLGNMNGMGFGLVQEGQSCC